jgi:hypothetical protein
MSVKIFRGGVIAAAIAAAFALAPTAGAATTIGQSPPVAGTPATGNGCTAPFDIDGVQASSVTGNSYQVPAGGGVITSWSTFTPNGSGMLRFRVYNLGTDGMTPVGESQVETLTPASPPEFPTRIPVSGGERIGYTVFNGAQLDNCTYENTGNEGDFARGSQGSAPIGQFELFFASPQPQALINLSAKLEPDADGDGYGDETQDGCPKDPSVQVRCADFTVGKPKVNAKKGTAKLPVNVDGPGLLKLSGKSIAAQLKQSSKAGTVKLLVKPKGKARKKLKQHGKLKVRATVTFTPTGGKPFDQPLKVKLKQKG